MFVDEGHSCPEECEQRWLIIRTIQDTELSDLMEPLPAPEGTILSSRLQQEPAARHLESLHDNKDVVSGKQAVRNETFCFPVFTVL